MQRFCRFLVANRRTVLAGLLVFMFYGFPSCYDDEAITNTVEIPCEEIIEEDGMIFHRIIYEGEEYNPWGFVPNSNPYTGFDLTAPTFLPPNNLPEEFRIDSLRVHLKLVKARIPEGVRLWAEPFIILKINLLEENN